MRAKDRASLADRMVIADDPTVVAIPQDRDARWFIRMTWQLSTCRKGELTIEQVEGGSTVVTILQNEVARPISPTT